MSDGDDRQAVRNGAPRIGGEGMWLAFMAAAAYLGFGAVMMFSDGGRPGTAAQAGVPLDAVLAVTQGSSVTQGASNAAPPAVGLGRIVPEGRNTADAVVFEAGPGLGGGVAAAQADGVVGVGAPGGAKLQFLVKLQDGETWRDRFLDDPNAARQAWSDFTGRNSAFAGLRLVRMSYSGEATLELEADAPPSPQVQREMADDIARRLRAASGVEYAEPNLVGVRESAE